MTLAVLGKIGGYSWLASCMARERRNDGGSSAVLMWVCWSVAAAASVKVGRHSQTAISPGRSLSLLDVEEWWVKAGDLLERSTDIVY